MSEIQDALSKKVGPLPGWTWIVIVAGGAYLWYRFTNGGSTATASTAGNTSVPEPTDTSSDNTGTVTPAPVVLSAGSLAPVNQSNSLLTALLAAIRRQNYILTHRKPVARKPGEPPIPHPPVPPHRPPHSPVPPGHRERHGPVRQPPPHHPPTHRKRKVAAHGDTLHSVTMATYGNPDHLPRVMAANPHITHGPTEPLAPGTVVRLP